MVMQSVAQEKIRGVCWVARDSITNTNFEPLLEANVDWISQTPFAYMHAHDSPEVRFDGSKNEHHWGESDYGLIKTTHLAHSCGIKVILKPHIWLRAKGGKWRSDIEMKSPEEWDTWFQNYGKMILHYAKVAEQGEMDALCIGTEILQATTKHPDQWRALIADIRKVYTGKLTYAANFYKEYERIEFWDALDFIGVQAYFPLAQSSFPTKTDLKKSWKSHIKKLKKVSKKFGKQIVFTEVGYRNTSDASIEPWLWPSQVSFDKIKISDETQALCYEAMFEVLWEEDWFSGLYIWKWFHGGHKLTNEQYFARRRAWIKKRLGEKNDIQAAIYFSPQGRLAEQVMARWFGAD